MKKCFALLITGILLFLPLSGWAEATAVPIPEATLAPDAPAYDAEHPEDLTPDQLYAYSAILITQDKGEVIFEKDPDTIRYPASMTKIMTILLGVMFVDDLYQTVIVSDEAVNIPSDSSSMKLKAGEEIRYIDVLYGAMILSGNDAANVVAETVSGSIPAFVDLMNQTAIAFGCTSTHFANANGYHDDNHYTTARDMAIIARQAMQNDIFRDLASATSWSVPKTNLQRARTITLSPAFHWMLPGSDESPNRYYTPEAVGIKTGTTSMSGYCYAGAATREGVSLISVVMFSANRARFADTIKLMNYGFSQYVSVTPVDLYNMNPITIETSSYSTSDTNRGRVQLVCQPAEAGKTATIVATKSEVQRMADQLTDTVLIQYTRDFIAPITAGEEMGTLTYFPEYGDPVVYRLTASRSVARRENAPKTLEEIVAETYADPNPLPPFSFELVMIFAGPFLILGLLILLIRLIRKRRHAKRMRVPKPVHRHLQ